MQITTLLFLLTVPAFTSCAFGQPGGKIADIELVQVAPGIAPTQFYIFKVDDERPDKVSIGTVAALNSEKIKLPGVLPARVTGGSAALRSFIISSLPANKSLRPLVVKIQSLEITEKPVAGDKADGRVAVSMQFGLLRDGEFIKLDDYTASSTYRRKAGAAQLAEPLLSNIIIKGLVYINRWMDEQAGRNMALAKGVKLIFTDHKNGNEEDTVYYDVHRPLKWSDFRARPHNGRYAAEIFASLGYDEDVKLVNGVINITLDVKVYLPKSACWVRNEGLNGYSLSHEQLHFDIVKLIAEHFKQRLLNERLSTYNYDGPINIAYLDALREMNDLQKQYDNETAHGLNSYRQLQWSEKTDKELQQIGVKPANAQAASFN